MRAWLGQRVVQCLGMVSEKRLKFHLMNASTLGIGQTGFQQDSDTHSSGGIHQVSFLLWEVLLLVVSHKKFPVMPSKIRLSKVTINEHTEEEYIKTY